MQSFAGVVLYYAHVLFQSATAPIRLLRAVLSPES